MTDNEAMDRLLAHKEWNFKCLDEAIDIAVEAFEMLMEYKAIGTVEEFKALKEKAEPKKPILKSGVSTMHIHYANKPHEWKTTQWQDWCCPVCGWFVGERFNRHRNSGELHPHDQRKSDYCNECGQAIYWEKNGDNMIIGVRK